MVNSLPEGFLLRHQYRILSSIGRGATSRVYLAKDQHEGQLCAIKAIAVDTTDPRGSVDMIGQEARLLTSLSHEGLPKIYDFFRGSDTDYLVMEWIAGETLYHIVLDQAMPAAETDVVRWGLELCNILDYLHGRRPNRVVVGDIKPSNVMRTYEGKIKLIDFGIARYADSGVKITAHAYVTPGFSPPEQYRRQGIDHRSDIYSLGATLYYLLTTQPMERFRFNVPSLRSVTPSCTRDIEHILTRCLESDRARRYQDIRELRDDLVLAQEVGGRQENVNSRAREILSLLYKSKKGNLDT